MPFEVTTAVRKMLALTARKKVIQGATFSGKTYGIIPIIIDKCIANKRIKATIVAESIPAVKDGAVKIFQDFMHDEGRWRDSQWIGSPMEYTFLNGSQLQFKSFDSLGKAKAAGKRDILFLNEGNHIVYPIADALMTRSKETWIDFNADASFWAHSQVLKEPFSEFLKLTYLDNEQMPEEAYELLMHRKGLAEQEEAAGMKGYWWNWWQVYGLGEIGSLQGVVFSNWDTVDRIPEGAKLIAHGMDFGYTNDPTTLVAAYMLDNEYYYDELLYRKGLSNSDLAALCKQHGLNQSTIVYADSADPKSIAELRTYGIFVMGAEKGKDSIQYGIGLMQEGRFHVTKRSINLIDELRNYTWMVEKDGSTSNVPIDAYNHLVDAVRYIHQSRKRNTGKYVIR